MFKKINRISAGLILMAASNTLYAECFSERSLLQHFHYLDGTQFSYESLKHWVPEDLKDLQGTYQSSGGGGGIVIVAHLADPKNPKSKTVFSGSFIKQGEYMSAPTIHNFQNLEIQSGEIRDPKFTAKFYRFPHYENQTEYFFISIENKIYVSTKTIKRKVTVDE